MAHQHRSVPHAVRPHYVTDVLSPLAAAPATTPAASRGPIGSVIPLVHVNLLSRRTSSAHNARNPVKEGSKSSGRRRKSSRRPKDPFPTHYLTVVRRLQAVTRARAGGRGATRRRRSGA